MTNPYAFMDIDALEHQAKYHPTADASVREQGTVKNGRVVRTTKQVQRRVVELKIWDDLDPAQTEAAQGIYRGWFIRTYPAQAKTMNLGDRVDGAGSNPDWQIQQSQKYDAWVDECRRMNAVRSINLCLAVFCNGFSMRNAGLMVRMDTKKVKPELVEGLDIYCKVNGMRG